MRAGVQCFGLNRGTEAELPRSLVSYLEDIVAQLELERLEHSSRAAEINSAIEIDPNTFDAYQNMYKLAAWAAATSSPTGVFEASMDPIPYQKAFFLSAELPFPLAIHTQHGSNEPLNAEERDPPRLPEQVANRLVAMYTERILPQVPLFTSQEIAHLYETYSNAKNHGTAISSEENFTISMILAISVLSSKSKDYHKLVSLAESLRRDAFAQLKIFESFGNTSLRTIQRLILVTQYGFLLPSSTNLWQVVGEAVKVALALGLHEEPPPHCGLDKAVVELRRRVFWVLYSIERSVAITSHRPLAVAGCQVRISSNSLDGSISFKRRLKILKIQSEICSVNIGMRAVPTIGWTYQEWASTTEASIIEAARMGNCRDFEFIVHQAMMLLHMPCARNPEPNDESVLKSLDAAEQLSTSYWELVQSGCIENPWHAVHNCYEAGMLLLYFMWYYPTIVRQQYTTAQVFDIVHHISGFFILIAKQWPAAQQCGNLFDYLRKGTLAAFRDGGNLPSHHDTEESKQLKGIVFRENADFLYANEVLRSTETLTSINNSFSFDNIDLSLELANNAEFLDFFSFSEGSYHHDIDQESACAGITSMETETTTPPVIQTNVQPPNCRESKIEIQLSEINKALETVPVCSSCKKRRIKCDMDLPCCRHCAKAKKECQYFDKALSQEIPRK